jgi:hypothetical protein
LVRGSDVTEPAKTARGGGMVWFGYFAGSSLFPDSNWRLFHIKKYDSVVVHRTP